MHPIKMRRIQVYLDPNRDSHLQYLVKKTGKPKAQLIRDGIDLLLEKESQKRPDSLLDLIGLGGQCGYPDAAESHDTYLYAREESQNNGEKNHEP
jgi:hypothetical protein